MWSRSILLVVWSVSLVATWGCASRSAARDDDAMVQFAMMLFPSTFQPALSAFYQGNGRWPRDMDEVLSLVSFPIDPRVQSFLKRTNLVPQPDGNLVIEFPGESGKRQRMRVDAPASVESKKFNQ